MPTFPEKEKVDDTHAFVETRDLNRHTAQDRKLRAFGFEIRLRPNGAQPRWEWVRHKGGDGEIYLQSQALEIVKQKLAEVET